MTGTALTGNWNYPNPISAGAGRIEELADICLSLGLRAPLLVTDPGLARLPMAQQILDHCLDAGLTCEVFAEIKSNPNGGNVANGVAAFHRGKHDGVIALGGGSALDAGKAIAFMSGQDRPLWDFEDMGDNWMRAREDSIAPLVAVPTTAGTGSEVGRAAIITDEARELKKIIFHPGMLPAAVILDPMLTTGLPADITAATGMDALSHNLEALCSPHYHPMAAGIAVEGIRLVREYLPRAVQDGQDLEARTQMLAASSMGAAAFQKGLGAMHALAHPLGALYDAHHGLLNAILMPYVLKANRAAIEDKLARTAAYIGLEQCSFDGFLDWVVDLRQAIGIPDKLILIGIDNSQRERIGQMACVDPCAQGNPIPYTAEQYATILSNAVGLDPQEDPQVSHEV